jgi:acyl-coenzyme A synthetase/AMP-(fatty) acid ligase
MNTKRTILWFDPFHDRLVEALPRTPTNKVMRRALREQYHARP